MFQLKYMGQSSFTALWLHNMGAWYISQHYASVARKLLDMKFIATADSKSYVLFRSSIYLMFEHEYESKHAISNSIE